MKFLKIFGLTILIIVVLVVVVSFFLPSKGIVERDIVINSTAPVIFNQINTLKNWEMWSPWHKIDPQMKLTYEGPPGGKDALYKWESTHPKVGNGILKIIESNPFDLIITSMDFMESGVATGIYKLEKNADGIKVTWRIETDLGMNPFTKYLGLMMDAMLGAEFEKGLNSLKVLSESLPPIIIDTETIPPQTIISIRESCKPAEISQKLGTIYREIMAFIQANGLKQAGPVLSIYHSYTPDKVDMEPAIPVDRIAKPTGKIKIGELRGNDVVVGYHYGSYESVGASYQILDEWIKKNNKNISGPSWEVYLTDPTTEPDTNKWLTKIYYPVK